jgi:putative glycosyltransferase (TIGR04372 family)
MFVDNLFSKINVSKSHRYLYLSPHVYAVGNCSFEILCGIIAAKSRGKKLVILYPYNIPFIFHWNLTNKELYLLESKYIAKQSKYIRPIIRLLVTIVYIPIRVYGLIVRNYFGKRIDESISIPRIGELEIFAPVHGEEKYDYSLMERYVLDWWGEDKIKDIDIRLPLKSERDSINQLKKTLGMLESDWYVCLHVRESGFRNDNGRREYRNSNVNNYIKAIKEITSRGGWVFRMGDDTMLRLPEMKRVIDYPFTSYKSNLNDLLLIKYCFFYIGTQSGILDVANLFSKNVLLTNMIDWSGSGLHGEKSRGILKHWYSKKEKSYVSFEWLFNNRLGFITEEYALWKNYSEASEWKDKHSFPASMDDYTLVENSEDEIKDLVVEYIELLNLDASPPTHLQELFIKYRSKYIHDLLSGNSIYMFDTDRRNRLSNFQYSLRTRISTGLISDNFLSKNWTYNSKNSS